ncbi:MAG TPA: dihydrofolate reductase family protein [Streptosporangiaceae bacterium]|nr:dihydrofolate reductase family protein [Streptosporangiaceae bacterium]
MLSCAMSIDGYIDDGSSERLMLSGPADLDRVDELRASCDAILVGAGTIRADDPRLVLRSDERRAARVAAGAAPDPVKVAITGTGQLDPQARFFTTGRSARLVYAASRSAADLTSRLTGRAEVIDGGDPVDLDRVLADLAGRGIERLLVEGGAAIATLFLTSGAADELQLAIAPFFVGDPKAPRFVGGGGAFEWTPAHPARLVKAGPVGQDVLLIYALSDRYRQP